MLIEMILEFKYIFDLFTFNLFLYGSNDATFDVGIRFVELKVGRRDLLKESFGLLVFFS